MEGTYEGVLQETEEITSSVKPSDPLPSSEDPTLSFDEGAFHMTIAMNITESDDQLVENEFVDALNEIDGVMVYPCKTCNKICKSKGGLTKHKNSKHVTDTADGSSYN